MFVAPSFRRRPHSHPQSHLQSYLHAGKGKEAGQQTGTILLGLFHLTREGATFGRTAGWYRSAVQDFRACVTGARTGTGAAADLAHHLTLQRCGLQGESRKVCQLLAQG